MTKKNINIILILLLLFIWGSIGYRYFVKKEVAENPVFKLHSKHLELFKKQTLKKQLRNESQWLQK